MPYHLRYDVATGHLMAREDTGNLVYDCRCVACQEDSEPQTFSVDLSLTAYCPACWPTGGWPEAFARWTTFPTLTSVEDAVLTRTGWCSWTADVAWNGAYTTYASAEDCANQVDPIETYQVTKLSIEVSFWRVAEGQFNRGVWAVAGSGDFHGVVVFLFDDQAQEGTINCSANGWGGQNAYVQEDCGSDANAAYGGACSVDAG